MQPLDDIVELNVGGKEDLCVRRSTLCQVESSALAAIGLGHRRFRRRRRRLCLRATLRGVGFGAHQSRCPRQTAPRATTVRRRSRKGGPYSWVLGPCGR